MSDPLERAIAVAPPILGEGCTQRYDPRALSAEDGAEFVDAAELWRKLQQPSEETDQQE
ncbi:hypothetical protein OU997_12910 [Pseudomonas sp. SL4(2022)]|uniref:hypothetical protein n=1 Tax=unclassified Pseudomonas TaxID=196821 RepID=UPI0015AB80E6|nr:MULTISPECIES: hypothetical protein [unclassified Pseudomonas]WAC43185.1 hypothetical protein OU997_12910 [Pseudomonas sp. SL4(2022)]